MFTTWWPCASVRIIGSRWLPSSIADECVSFKPSAMANKKTRVATPAKTPKKAELSNFATQKLGSDIVSLPPVFSKDAKYVSLLLTSFR